MIISLQSRFLNILSWYSKLMNRSNQICRVEIKSHRGPMFATGFLIGPNVVITTYHTFKSFTPDLATFDPTCVTLRFDYRLLTDGTSLDMGKEYYLEPDHWLIDFSPLGGAGGTPRPEQLDYILLRVQGNPGLEQIRGAWANTTVRGWIEILDEDYRFDAGESIVVLQHPEGAPLKLAFNSTALVEISDDGASITYNVNTSPGSSGSPCFNLDLDLIALHQGANTELRSNRGVTVNSIANSLKEKGYQELIQQKIKDYVTTRPIESARDTWYPSDPALEQIIAEGETQETEFKEVLCRNPHTGKKDKKIIEKTIRAVASLMNSDGGRVLLGVSDTGQIIGINAEYAVANKQKANWDGYMLMLRDVLNNSFHAKDQYIDIDIRLYSIRGKDICCITVSRAEGPIYYKSDFYIRSGGQTRLLAAEEAAAYIRKHWS